MERLQELDEDEYRVAEEESGEDEAEDSENDQ